MGFLGFLDELMLLESIVDVNDEVGPHFKARLPGLLPCLARPISHRDIPLVLLLTFSRDLNDKFFAVIHPIQVIGIEVP